MTDTQPLAEVKAHLSSYIDRVEREHERVLITRNGRPVAILVSPDDIESMEETLDILRDPETMAALRESEADIRARRTVSLDEILAERRDRPAS